jgi:Bifunctional DNA primase/polymerase, N-terminal
VLNVRGKNWNRWACNSISRVNANGSPPQRAVAEQNKLQNYTAMIRKSRTIASPVEVDANALLAAALTYTARGWCVIPTAGKKARFTWKRFQTERPTEDLLRDWFSGRFDDISGLAVVTGKVSGGLAVRDFDDADAFERWAEEHPQLATTLPTVETARGRHVYFRGPAIFKDFGNGEYRGDARHYCLLPPSGHPSGQAYRWLIPLPNGELPVVDPFQAGLCNTEDTVNGVDRVNTEDTVNTDFQLVSSAPTAPTVSSVLQTAANAINATLPTAQGQRGRCIFNLARHLKSNPSLNNADAGHLRPVVEDWHRRALPVIGTKPFLETWTDFVQAWKRVKVPANEGLINRAFQRAVATEPPPIAIRLYGEGPIVLLAALCRELQRIVGDGEFFLDCRTAGGLIGVDHTTAWRWLEVLCADGVLKAGAKGSKATKRASRFRFINPEAGGEAKP